MLKTVGGSTGPQKSLILALIRFEQRVHEILLVHPQMRPYGMSFLFDAQIFPLLLAVTNEVAIVTGVDVVVDADHSETSHCIQKHRKTVP